MANKSLFNLNNMYKTEGGRHFFKTFPEHPQALSAWYVSPPETGWMTLGYRELRHVQNTGNVAVVLVSFDRDGREQEGSGQIVFPGEEIARYRVPPGGVDIGVSIVYPPGDGPRPGDVSELRFVPTA